MKTSSGAKTPAEYIASLAEPRKTEVALLDALIRKTLPKQKPVIQSGMLGYGSFHYKYASGREGDWCLVMLASQKNYISLYVCASDGKKYVAEEYKNQLPKASIGKSCIRFKRIADIDLKVITNILKRAQQLGGFGEV